MIILPMPSKGGAKGIVSEFGSKRKAGAFCSDDGGFIGLLFILYTIVGPDRWVRG